MEQKQTGDGLQISNAAWLAIGIAIGFVLTFWLGFGVMMGLNPAG